MLGLGVGDGVESSDGHDLHDGGAGSIVGIRVGAQHAAEVRLEPQLVGRFSPLASFVDTVALDGAGEGGVHTHVDSGEGIVAAVGALEGLVRRRLPVFLVRQRVDVGGETCGRRSIHAGDMVVDANLFLGVLDGLLQEVHQIRGSQFAQGEQGLGAGIEGIV